MSFKDIVQRPLGRRLFLQGLSAGLFGALAGRSLLDGTECAGAQSDLPIKQYFPLIYPAPKTTSSVHVVRNVAVPTFPGGDNHHPGVESVLTLLGQNGIKFYRSSTVDTLSGPDGIVAVNDVVLIKVNAQWKYRGATNSDVVRGVIQRVLDHPAGFTGEVVIVENGQGRGSLSCSQTGNGYPDGSVQANAENHLHSFAYLASTVFGTTGRVSTFLLDPVAGVQVGGTDNTTNGYRTLKPHPERDQWNISYPCFTTTGGHRVELALGLWNSQTRRYEPDRLKLINMPVLKTHGGSGVTGALKLFYGVLSMSLRSDAGHYHYDRIGTVLGEMMAHVKAPDLNIMDCIWICQGQLAGYPASATSRQNTLVAGLDPVALDYWAAKNILYNYDHNPNHNPDDPSHYTDSFLSGYLDQAVAEINGCGGIRGQLVTRQDSAIAVHSA